LNFYCYIVTNFKNTFTSRTFTLANSNDYGYNATATGAGDAGTYTREAGFLAYYEVIKPINLLNICIYI